jgi:hypothetical protein
MADDSPKLGFLQLCGERLYHRKIMAAFEDATGLAPNEYWIEARPGGAAAYADKTIAARHAYKNGARIMGWAAHGEGCRGFPGASNEELRRKLRRAAQKRADDFPLVRHFQLFGEGGQVTVTSG